MKGLKLLGNVARQAWMLLMAVLMLVIVLPVTTYAEEGTADTVIYWKVEEIANGDGSFDTVLYLGNNNTDAEMVGAETWDMTSYNQRPDIVNRIAWNNQRDIITKVKIVSEIAPSNTSHWFHSMDYCTEMEIDKLNTQYVGKMYNMFASNSRLKSLELGDKFDTSNVTDMGYMFSNCSALETLDLGEHFDTSNVTNMCYMFHYCRGLESLNLGEYFDTTNVTNMAYMFNHNNALSQIDFGDKFDTSNVTNMSGMFCGCDSLESLDLSDFNTAKVTNMSNMFYSCDALQSLVLGENFDTSQVTEMYGIFRSCPSLESLVLNEKFVVDNATNLKYMFMECTALTSLTWKGNFNVLKTTNLTEMFHGCTNLSEVKFEANIDTSKVTNMSYMFQNCKSLADFGFLEGFDTSAVTNMQNMFSGCTSLDSLDFLKNMDTSAVTNMSYMFQNCTALKDAAFPENFNTSNVQSMSYMFYNCKALTEFEVSAFNTENVTLIYNMFSCCTNLRKLDISAFAFTETTTSYSNMFSGSNICILKTPKVNSIESGIELEYTYYEADSETAYEYLPVTTGTPKTLYRGNSITYNLAGGEVAIENPTMYFSDEEEYTFELCTPTKEGYTFDGWKLGGAYNCSVRINGSTVIVPRYAYGDITLTASWNKHMHCSCDSGYDCGNSHSTGRVWTPWMETGELPDAAGYYYLIADVTLDAAWEPVDGSYLCLNGHSIMNENGTAIRVPDAVTFGLTDCETGNTNVVSGGVRNEGNFYVSGAPNIVGGGVYLPTGKTVGIMGALENTARIYVTMETPGVVTSGWGAHVTRMSDKVPSHYFISSDARYGAISLDNEVQLAESCTITVEDMVHGTVKTDQTVAGAAVAEGVLVTLTVTPDTGYLLKDIKVLKKDDSSTEVPLTLSGSKYSFAMPAYDVTIKAEFEIKTYTITYTPGTDGVGDVVTATKKHGETLILPDVLFTREGYVQHGWAISENGGRAYGLNSTWSVNADETLYPAWKAYLTGTVAIDGSAKAGETLTASITDSNASGTFYYQWYRDKTAISGATKATYTTTKKDVGYPIKCVMRTSAQEGSVESAPTANIEMQEFLSDEIIVTGYNGVYDGAEHGITIELPEKVADATILYGTQSGVYNLSESPTRSQVGGTHVYYQITKENYAPMTGSAYIGISRVRLTVKAQDETIIYGDAMPECEVVISGFVNNETESVLSGAITFDCIYKNNQAVGKYSIVPDGLKADNYWFDYVSGWLTVEPKTVNVTWGNNEFAYNGDAQKPEASTTDFVAGDDVYLVVAGEQTNANVEGETYTATVQLGGEDADNYVFADNAQTSIDFIISKVNPELGIVGYAGEVTEETKPEDVVLTRTNITVDGSLKLTDEVMQTGQSEYHWKFTPTGEDAQNYNEITGTVNITVQSVEENPGTNDGGDKDPEPGTNDGGDKDPEPGTNDGGDEDPEPGTNDGGDKDPEQNPDGGDKDPEQNPDGGDKEPEQTPDDGEDKEPEPTPDDGEDKDPEQTPDNEDDKEPEQTPEQGTNDGGDKEPEQKPDEQPGVVPEVGLKVKLANPGKTYVYTGSAIKPEIIVTNNGELLSAGIDYTVKYSNNVKASTSRKPAKITVKGKGNLSGSVSTSFMIMPKNIADEDVIGGAVVVLSGAKANPVLVYNHKKLSAKDFTNPDAKVKFTEDGSITISGKGNFVGTRTLVVDVVDKSELKKFAVEVGKEVLTYNGKVQKPTITVTDKVTGAVLAEGIDYAISYSGNGVNAGTVKFTVVGLGYYTGTVTKSYKINAFATSNMNISGINSDGYSYVASGVTFGQELVVTCELTGEVLKNGVDYKITYSGNKKVGTAKYTISFLGNYKGSTPVKGSFTIKANPLSNNTEGLKVVVGDQAYKGKADIYKSVPLVAIKGVALKASDYTVTYYKDAELTNQITGKNKVDLGENEESVTIYVKIEGKKNYASAKGEFATAEYKVTKAATYDLAKARVTFWDGNTKLTKVEYTGMELEPAVKVECKVGKTWVTVPEEQYEVMYTNNINKGTASVVVNATGSECAGSKTAKFKIVSKDIKSLSDLLKDLFGI